MKRQEILETAIRVVTKDRAATHGDAESSFADIAAIWSCRLGVDITAYQVSIMMIDLKTVRAWNNPEYDDNWIDIAGYSACGGEIATNDLIQTNAPASVPDIRAGLWHSTDEPGIAWPIRVFNKETFEFESSCGDKFDDDRGERWVDFPGNGVFRITRSVRK